MRESTMLAYDVTNTVNKDYHDITDRSPALSPGVGELSASRATGLELPEVPDRVETLFDENAF